MNKDLVEVVAQKWHLSKQIVKYVISGGTAAVVELLLLYIFTDFFGIWYILSFLLSFTFAFSVSFFMQKFWTFQDANVDAIHKQISLHFITTIVHAGLNIVALYIAVEYLGMWYVLAQVLIGGILALSSFFVYKFFIFTYDRTSVIS